MTSGTVLEASGLRKAFGSFVAVDDVSFAIARGEILGLLGPNGAGKTTTIQMLLGLITPTAGTIRIFGMDLARHREAILQRVNFSSTYVSLPYTLSVRENLAVFGRLYGIKPLNPRIDAVMELLNLEDLADRQTRQLSSGQLTRLHLAKALLNEPELLFLDEPTASLDPDTADQIRQLLKRLRAERQLSILYTSHNMAEMQEMSDRVVFLSQGRVLATGTPQDLIARFEAEDLEELFLKIARGHLEA
jgi:ABC-type multidrug transport system, ATPase component